MTPARRPAKALERLAEGILSSIGRTVWIDPVTDSFFCPVPKAVTTTFCSVLASSERVMERMVVFSTRMVLEV